MKAMVIGIPPEYIYPGTIQEWSRSNTYYAANLGASLITNSLLRQFPADYIGVDQFNDIGDLKNRYDVCILAFATHIHPRRDVSIFADLLEKLNIQTVVISAGISDYDQKASISYQIHPSMRRILHRAAESSQWIGVRGHYTASVLRSNGFKNVVPIGCPSTYWPLDRDIVIAKPKGFTKPLVAYHRLIAINCYEAIRSIPLLGQDWQDQPLFTDTLQNDTGLWNYLNRTYAEKGDELKKKILDIIDSNGHFFFHFKQWFNFIGKHDFVIGGRLHGTIAALIQQIPAVLVPRDLRTREIAEFYNLPTATYEDLNRYLIEGVFHRADFADFNETYALRRANYIKLLDENGLNHKLTQTKKLEDFKFTFDDFNSSINLAYSMLSDLRSDLELVREEQRLFREGMLITRIRRLIGYLRYAIGKLLRRGMKKINRMVGKV